MMPTYDFECLKCKHKQEGFFSMTKAPPFINCEKCGNMSERLIGGGAGVIFKGPNWTPKFHDKEVKEND